MKHLLFVFIGLFLLSSCGDFGKKAAINAGKDKFLKDSIAQAEKDSISSLPQNRVGKYVYIDHYGVLHISLHCRYINFVSYTDREMTDDEGNLVNESSDVRRGSGIKRVLLEDMAISMLKDACHHCIDDDMYDYLKSEISSRKESPGKPKKHLGINWV